MRIIYMVLATCKDSEWDTIGQVLLFIFISLINDGQ